MVLSELHYVYVPFRKECYAPARSGLAKLVEFYIVISFARDVVLGVNVLYSFSLVPDIFRGVNLVEVLLKWRDLSYPRTIPMTLSDTHYLLFKSTALTMT